MRIKLRGMRRGSKGWWRLSRSLLGHAERMSSIPSLRDADSTWIHDAAGKANLFAKTFASNWTLPAEEFNEWSACLTFEHTMSHFLLVRTRHAKSLLRSLQESSGTGPDLLPTRILKNCANSLALPVALLARAILRAGSWPRLWCTHWICPLFKKRSLSDPLNYRGIQLTAQLSKCYRAPSW